IEHDADILDAFGAQRIKRGAVGEKNVMHGAGGGAHIAVAGGMHAKEMAEIGDAPWLVDCGSGVEPVSKLVADHGGVVRKPAGDIAVHPAALILQGGG